MTGPAVLSELRGLGASVSLQGPDLRVIAAPGAKLPRDLVERLKGEKPAIVEWLTAEAEPKPPKPPKLSEGASSPPQLEGVVLLTNASSAQPHASSPQETVLSVDALLAGVELLQRMDPPRDFAGHWRRWNGVVGGAIRFTNAGWIERALALNWSPLEIWGLHPRAPAARDDSRGLAMSLNAGDVIVITDAFAVVRSHQGGELRHYRWRGPREARLAWELGEGPA